MLSRMEKSNKASLVAACEQELNTVEDDREGLRSITGGEAAEDASWRALAVAVAVAISFLFLLSTSSSLRFSRGSFSAHLGSSRTLRLFAES